MTLDDGFITRQACLQRLVEMLGDSAPLAPGMGSPLGLPWGCYLTKDVLPGTQAVMLFWHDATQPADAVVVNGRNRRSATDDELRAVLQHFENHVQLYLQNRLPLPSAAHPLRSSTLCPEIVPAHQVN